MIYDIKEIKKRFGEKVRKYRKEANLTQEKLAEKLGCAYQTVSGYETGRSFPPSTILFQLSFFLNTPLVYFFNFYPILIDNDQEAQMLNSFKKLDKKQQKMLLTMINSIIQTQDEGKF